MIIGGQLEQLERKHDGITLLFENGIESLEATERECKG